MDFVILTLVIWALLAVAFGEAEDAWPNLIISGLALGVLYFLKAVELPDFVSLFLGLGAYVAVGIGYSIARWLLLLQAMRRLHAEQGMKMVTLRYSVYSLPPKTELFRGKLANWIMWWPASMLFNALAYVGRVGFTIADHLTGFYSRLSKRAFPGTYE